jgi:hypothetical protein
MGVNYTERDSKLVFDGVGLPLTLNLLAVTQLFGVGLLQHRLCLIQIQGAFLSNSQF